MLGPMLMETSVTVKDLLEAGAHFGHQTHRWNPKIKEYIFGARNGIHIINLTTTQKMLEQACDFVKSCVAAGGKILFVGTKRQAQELIRNDAQNCGMNYVTFRWLGGMLTNFDTIRIGINRLNQIEEMRSKGVFASLPKKEVSVLEKESGKLERVFSGIRDMTDLPA